MDRKSYESAATMLEYIITSQSLYDKLSEAQIIRLIEFSPSNLKEFFDKSVAIEQDGGLPQFGVLRDEVSFILSDNSALLRSDVEKLVDEEQEKSEAAEPLQFKSILFPYNLTPGSQSSINFHKALLESASNSLDPFRSQAVQAILTYKWNLIKFRAWINAFVYLLYIIALGAHVLHKGVLTVIPLVGFAFYFLGFELLQAYINKLEYFTSFWNVFDFIRLILLSIYLLTWIREKEHALMSHEFQLYLLATVNLFSWFRTLSYLRMF